MYAEMSKLKDFDRYIIPKHWYKKYNIAPTNPIATTREITESNYAFKMAHAPKSLPTLIHPPSAPIPPIERIEYAPLTIETKPVENTEQVSPQNTEK